MINIYKRKEKGMSNYVTTFEKEKAIHIEDGFDAMSVIPGGFQTDIVFDYAVFQAGKIPAPEKNEVQKTYIIIKGTGCLEIDGEEYEVSPGKIFWCKKGSVVIYKPATEDIHLVCVK